MSRPRTTFTARGPADLIAVVPYLLGFHPQESVVLMTFGPGETFHARVDLPVDPDDQVVVTDMLLEVVVRHGVRRVAVLVYTSDPWVAATFHDAVLPAMTRRAVEVVDVIRVDDERFHDAGDPEDPGTAYDLRAHPFTAEQVVEGTVVHATRAQLAATLEPVEGEVAAVEAALARAAARHGGLRGEAGWVERTVAAHLDGDGLPVDDVARLLVLLGTDQLRDLAWASMRRDDARRHLELWRGVVRRCPEALVAAPASLLAFAAWLDGNGALAWCALDRVAAVDPAYPMAGFVGALLEQAVPPAAWSAATVHAMPVGEGDEPAAS
jgi:hypothetical protein